MCVADGTTRWEGREREGGWKRDGVEWGQKLEIENVEYEKRGTRWYVVKTEYRTKWQEKAGGDTGDTDAGKEKTRTKRKEKAGYLTRPE